MPSRASPAPPSITIPPVSVVASAIPAASAAKRSGRARSSSFVTVQPVGGKSVEEDLDQNAYNNINADWVNQKGAWVIHPLLILTGKVLVHSIPGITQEASWTIVNLGYLLLSYIMFHYVTGVPFDPDQNGGAYDDLTLWEQIDGGAQYTPAKKWLFCTPVALFLISTHYTNYNLWLFIINFTALLFVLIPKLPQLHRQRVRFLPEEEDASGMQTPLTPSPFAREPSDSTAPALSQR
ncbi:hypothetical protein BOTBODRAFT_166173 [Botryobasidium botryosum FD-172 SS1]|uniref:Uncharacterized protein n=1 Tax=Botryobasidium botryosum (strain FD-172 SS1) TaxID=930990 RepID=A0A067M0S9_BOTB1|nr:hypothetical protein BOTBODRAFT_166173 [Botryobasidium botryosum FD-172 SS1]